MSTDSSRLPQAQTFGNDLEQLGTATSSDDRNGKVEAYTGNNADEDEDLRLSRQPTLLERVHTQYSFFNEKLKSKRLTVAKDIGVAYFILAAFVLGILSVYWGSSFERNDRLRNLKMLVVIEDDQTIDNIPPLIGNYLRQTVETDAARHYGEWHIYNSSEFGALAATHNNTIMQEVERQVHHQKFWSSIYVKANASYNFYNAVVEGDTTYAVSNNSIVSVYETGRDYLNMNSYITPSIQKVERMWLAESINATSALVDLISNKTVLANQNSVRVATSPMAFAYFDLRPVTDPVLSAPSQVGLIYIIIITFIQFNFFAPIHALVARFKLKPLHFVGYRVIISVVSFFFMSLAYSLVSLAMQVDFTKAFGKAGFVVYWMFTFLTMMAVGFPNEIMGMILFSTYPPLLGAWLLFWVIINISATFAPLALCPKFFRYGYGLPIHNSYELSKVVLFDTYKGELGRNIGIVIAWVALGLVLMPVVFVITGKRMAKKAEAQRREILREAGVEA